MYGVCISVRISYTESIFTSVHYLYLRLNQSRLSMAISCVSPNLGKSDAIRTYICADTPISQTTLN